MLPPGRGSNAEPGVTNFFFSLCRFFLCLGLWLCPGAVPALQAGAGADDLVLKNEAGKVLFSCPADEGFSFGIRYIHSVARSPVEDWFRVRRHVIFLEKTVYQDFGAGLPHNPEPGQTMSAGQGHIVISGYDRALPSFDVRVGRIARHTLLLPRPETASGVAHKGADTVREIPLDSLARPGSAVTFMLETFSRAKPAAPAVSAETGNMAGGGGSNRK